MNKQTLALLKGFVPQISINEVGLFKGKIGVCVALYVISKETRDMELEKQADALLAECLSKIQYVKDLSIDKGLTGIGLALMFLIANNYAEGDIDDVLEDIDAYLYKNLKNDSIKYGMSCTSGLVGFLMYLVERLSLGQDRSAIPYQLNAALLRLVVDKLEEQLPKQLDNCTKDVYTSAINNIPILFIYFKKALDLGLYNNKILVCIRLWSSYIVTHMPYYGINRLYLAVALAYMNGTVQNQLIEKYVRQLLSTIDVDNLCKETSAEIMNINEGLFFVEILLLAAERLFLGTDFQKRCHRVRIGIQQSHNERYKDFITCRTLKDADLSLVNGFIGVECINAIYPYVFNFNKNYSYISQENEH
ncbi:MAG: hypothetical protein K2J00_02535 [Bacteroidaceae bacterium]|nr:hypothetical protein [Bacteroidaceae bacterium]